MTILVSSGAGFMGSSFLLDRLLQRDDTVINLDKLTYTANTETFVSPQGDISDRALMERLLAEHRLNGREPCRSLHKRSDELIQTNIIGTFNMLEPLLGTQSGLL